MFLASVFHLLFRRLFCRFLWFDSLLLFLFMLGVLFLLMCFSWCGIGFLSLNFSVSVLLFFFLSRCSSGFLSASSLRWRFVLLRMGSSSFLLLWFNSLGFSGLLLW